MNQPSHSRAKIALICLSSRLVVLFAQLVSNLALPDHKSKDAFVSPSVSKFTRSALDKIVQDYLFSGLNHWDGQWFLSIAVAGSYEDEQKLVFLPVFPLCLHFVSKVISVLSLGFLNPVSAVMLASVLVNTLAFCLAGIALYRLTLIFWPFNHSFAEETILWFAYNPASIFFTATYSESIYSALTFMGLTALYSKQHFLSSILFALSTLTRSNGLLNAGYLLFHLLLFIIAQFTLQNGRLIDTSVKFVIYTLGIIISIGPFYWYQRKYIPSKFCPGSSFCSVLPQASNGSLSSHSFFPYVFLQNQYWNQGLLKYFEMKQLPNFIIASPIIIFVAVISAGYLRNIIASNFTSNVTKPRGCSLFNLTSQPGAVINQNHQKRLLPFVLHTLALALVSLFFLHVQVATRLICSSSPLIYWYASSLESASKAHRLTKIYFTSYFFIGVVAFANSLPWT